MSQFHHKMKSQNAWVADEVQYQDQSMNPAAANIVRLQPVIEARCGNMWSPCVRLEPRHPHTEAQRLEVMPPLVEPWQLGPVNQTLPTLVRAYVGGPEGTTVYCLKITCIQCCAAQFFPSFARFPTEEEMQPEKERWNNEFCNYNGNQVDRLVPNENGQQYQSCNPPFGSRHTYLNPDAPEFYGPQVGSVKPVGAVKPVEPVGPAKSPTVLNPEAPPFIGPVEKQHKSSEVVQYTQKPHVQNSRPNDKKTKNRRIKQKIRPRNRLCPATNYQGTQGRGSNSTQQPHQPQSQQAVPGDAELAQMFKDTTIHMMDRAGIPCGVSPVPVGFCWRPEVEAALHSMSASTGHFLPAVGRLDYR